MARSDAFFRGQLIHLSEVAQWTRETNEEFVAMLWLFQQCSNSG